MLTLALRDEGMEVIYTGIRQTPEKIVKAAIQEDVDGIGMSILSGAHMTLFPADVNLLKKNDADSIAVFGGGIIPDGDAAALREAGVKAIFTPGASTQVIVSWVKENVKPRAI